MSFPTRLKNQFSRLRLGVPVRAAYGTTETGCITRLRSSSYEHGEAGNWSYVEFAKETNCRFVPRNDWEGTYELVLLVSTNLGHASVIYMY